MSTPLNASLLKGFEILSLFSEAEVEITAATVVDRLGMNAATAHRLLMTLERAGAVSATRRGHFILGPRIEELGRLAEASNPWSSVLTPRLEALSEELRESVMACRMSRLGPVCIGVTGSPQTITVNVRLGSVLPFPTTAQGKLWLAEMAPKEREQRLSSLTLLGHATPDTAALEAELIQIADEGIAMNLGGNEPDIGAIAVPVRDRKGKMRLSLSVFGLLSRFDASFLDRARSALTKAAEQVGAALT